MSSQDTSPSPSSRDRLPSQISYIVGNEACERFSFYGMRAILTIYMAQYLFVGLMPKEAAEEQSKIIYHLFVAVTYFTPLLGGWLSDRYLGKYKTIMSLSLVYCLGHAVLAIFEGSVGWFYVGLGLIALGAGGIKPCVSAHVGDQFDESNKHLLKKVFDVFYFSINLGSLVSTLLIPWVRAKYGPGLAFGIPGLLMLIATVIFWMGRHEFVTVPPTGPNPHSFSRIVGTALKKQPVWIVSVLGLFVSLLAVITSFVLHGLRLEDQTFERFFDWVALGGLSLALLGGLIAWLQKKVFLPEEDLKKSFPAPAVEGAAAALRVMRLFLFISIFWMLFDQHGSTWVLQSNQMERNVLGWEFLPDQTPFLNPALVMMLIPIFAVFIYPFFQKRGYPLTPLRRMTAGMFVAASSFVVVAILQLWIDGGVRVHVLWQLIPYVLITAAEVMISITGLEFAYTQAPRSMKSTLMSFWLVTVTIGNILTAYIEKLAPFEGFGLFMFYAVLMVLAGVIFGLMARRYKVVEYIEKDRASAERGEEAALPAGSAS